MATAEITVIFQRRFLLFTVVRHLFGSVFLDTRCNRETLREWSADPLDPAGNRFASALVIPLWLRRNISCPWSSLRTVRSVSLRSRALNARESDAVVTACWRSDSPEPTKRVLKDPDPASGYLSMCGTKRAKLFDSNALPGRTDFRN